MQPINAPSVRNYNNIGTRNNGFEYRIMPLSFNLQQRGNSKIKYEKRVKFNVSDRVTGICYYDKKEHSGQILNIVYNEETNKPITAYILDNENKFVLPLKYSTLEHYIEFD